MPTPKLATPNQWEVVVGNVGTVFFGTNGFEARRIYGKYVRISATHVNSRAYNEQVTLFKNGDIRYSYDPLTLESGESDA